jgi:hypothetical protein
VNDIRIFGIGDHPDITGWSNALETLECELKECFPHSQDINKLLGTVGGAHGPEPAADAPSHNDQMIIMRCHNYNELIW